MTGCIVGWAHTPFGRLDAESVETLIAHNLAIDATLRVARWTTGRVERDSEVNRIIYRAIRGALRLARQQIALRASGTMTFAVG